MKKLICLMMFLFVGCATVQPINSELRFFHDENRGDVRFICWRSNNMGWQCKRTDLKWPADLIKTKRVIKIAK